MGHLLYRSQVGRDQARMPSPDKTHPGAGGDGGGRGGGGEGDGEGGCKIIMVAIILKIIVVFAVCGNHKNMPQLVASQCMLQGIEARSTMNVTY